MQSKTCEVPTRSSLLYVFCMRGRGRTCLTWFFWKTFEKSYGDEPNDRGPFWGAPAPSPLSALGVANHDFVNISIFFRRLLITFLFVFFLFLFLSCTFFKTVYCAVVRRRITSALFWKCKRDNRERNRVLFYESWKWTFWCNFQKRIFIHLGIMGMDAV